MVELTGWLGFILVAGALLPYILRRFNLRKAGLLLYSANHHNLALASILVLTVHGLLVLTGRRGWGWGAQVLFKGHLLSGLLTWCVLAAVVLLAMLTARRKSRLNTLLAGIAAGFANAQSRFLKCCFRIGKELTNFFWFCAGNPTFEHSTDLPEDVNNRRQP